MRRLLKPFTLKSSGLSLPSFREVDLTTGTKESRHTCRNRARWAEGRSEPERFIVAGDRIIVFVHVRARLKDSRQWHEARLADVFTFRNGKVIQMRAFADRQQALKWAGVKDSDAN